jgi:hypothetical protein
MVHFYEEKKNASKAAKALYFDGFNEILVRSNFHILGVLCCNELGFIECFSKGSM